MINLVSHVFHLPEKKYDLTFKFIKDPCIQCLSQGMLLQELRTSKSSNQRSSIFYVTKKVPITRIYIPWSTAFPDSPTVIPMKMRDSPSGVTTKTTMIYQLPLLLLN